ncbi:MAG TPA: hypothetical protein P5316_15835, partial [Phycisphaerae bacterium]|nr:hypothetical protein [Phycisphaerae bacterium]
CVSSRKHPFLTPQPLRADIAIERASPGCPARVSPPAEKPRLEALFKGIHWERTDMRLGLEKKKHSLLRTLACLATGGMVLSVIGCEGEVGGVMVDALEAALQAAIPGLMDLLRADVVNDGSGTGTGGGSLPTVMHEAVQMVRLMLA